MKSKKVKCWGIPYGLTTKKNETQEMTIEMGNVTVDEFKEYCKKEGHKLTGKPYKK